jgi:hypothetical protein
MSGNSPELGGTRQTEINLNDLNVSRAIASSVFIEAVQMPFNGKSLDESGQLLNLPASDLPALGLSPADQADQLIVTTAHGLTEHTPEVIKVTTSDGKVYGATLVKLDDALDLAILKVDGLEKVAPGNPDWLPSVTIADSSEQQNTIGDFIYSVGHVGNNGNDQNVHVQGGSYLGFSSLAGELGRTDAFFAQNNQATSYEQNAQNLINALPQPEQSEASFNFSQPLIQSDTSGQQGESGGGLFNKNGQLIGVMDFTEQPLGQGFVPHDSYVPATAIQTLITEIPKFSPTSQTSDDNAYPEVFISRTNNNPCPPFNLFLLSPDSDR